MKTGFCNRCGQPIVDGKMDWIRWLITGTDSDGLCEHVTRSEVVHWICEDCMESFGKWWDEGGNGSKC